MGTCSQCGGSGQTTCNECYGSGKRYDGKPCNYCKGTKRYKRPRCGGSGRTISSAMMRNAHQHRRVVVKGDGKTLYRISEYGGWFYAYQVDVGFISNDNNSIGKARSLGDALELIKSHSGREIRQID